MYVWVFCLCVVYVCGEEAVSVPGRFVFILCVQESGCVVFVLCTCMFLLAIICANVYTGKVRERQSQLSSKPVLQG